jgi:hypothetical protein
MDRRVVLQHALCSWRREQKVVSLPIRPRFGNISLAQRPTLASAVGRLSKYEASQHFHVGCYSEARSDWKPVPSRGLGRAFTETNHQGWDDAARLAQSVSLCCLE